MFIRKKPTAIVPTNDYVFKRLFGQVGNEKITKSLISSIINQKITSINLDGNTILEKDLLDDKFGILDIKATLDSNIICNIEMQVLSNENIIKRILYYWSKLYSKSINSGKNYLELKKTISILFANFEIKSISEIPKFHTEWKIKEKDFPKMVLTEDLELHIITLPKLKEALKNNTISKEDKELALWSKFIINPDDVEVSEMKNNKAIKTAKTEIDKLRNNEYEERLAELREKKIMDDKDYIYTGYVQGIKKGIQKGIEKGIQQTTKKALKEKIEIAKKFIEYGLPIEKVLEITNLTEDDLKNI